MKIRLQHDTPLLDPFPVWPPFAFRLIVLVHADLDGMGVKREGPGPGLCLCLCPRSAGQRAAVSVSVSGSPIRPRQGGPSLVPPDPRQVPRSSGLASAGTCGAVPWLYVRQ
jgi:hypothetical protein